MSRAVARLLAVAVVVFACAGSLLGSSPAGAVANSFVHVVRSGETLASIAQRYYGDPRRESVLVAENGLSEHGGSAIVVGLRLVIPWVDHHIVEEGQTWAGIAEHYYGNVSRQFLLVTVNDGTNGEQPAIGAELLIPYPLRHVAGQNANLRRIGGTFFPDGGADSVRMLRRFNGMRGLRPARGQVVLIPLSDLSLSEEGRRVIEEATGEQIEGGQVRELQQQIEARVPELGEHVRRGRFAEAVSVGNQLLGAGQLTGNQMVSIQRKLGTAYVALGRPDLAIAAFSAALALQQDLELDVARTSPTVLRAFGEAKERLSEGADADEGAGDADDEGGETTPADPEVGDN